MYGMRSTSRGVLWRKADVIQISQPASIERTNHEDIWNARHDTEFVCRNRVAPWCVVPRASGSESIKQPT